MASTQPDNTKVAIVRYRSAASAASGSSHSRYQGTSQADVSRIANVAQPAMRIGSAPRHVRHSVQPATPANVSRTTSASLCAALTTCTSTSGLSPTKSAGRTGSRPSRSAVRHTSATTPSEAAAATTFRIQYAAGTPSGESGYVSSVNAG